MKTAAIYARISKDREGTENGVRRQVDECLKWAKAHNVDVADTYIDNDISATTGKRRPEYDRMCADIQQRRRDGVIAWHLDRLHRNPIELEQFIILIESTGADVRTVSGGDYDLSTSDGRAMARVVGAFARKESEDKSRRIKSQKRQRAHDGKRVSGGRRAYGFNVAHNQLVPEEAAIIAECAKRALAGESIFSICIDLNERGVPSASGRKWSAQVLRRIITSGAVSGQVEHLGEIVSSADWPAILTPAQTSQLRRSLLNRPRGASRAPRRYPLAGLVVCGRCGAKMVGKPRGDGTRRYFCAKGVDGVGCNKTTIISDTFEEFVAEAVLYRLDTPELQRKLISVAAQDDQADALQADIDQSQAALDELAQAYGARSITIREWLMAREPIEERQVEASRRMGQLIGSSALEGYVGNADHLRAQWADLAPDRQRTIIGAIVNHVTVNAAVKGRTRFDSDRLEIIWRV
jgi:DNA invertase Pin-like site-specific DNA recombinase